MIFVSQEADVAWTSIQTDAWRKATSRFWSVAEADAKRIKVSTAWFQCPTYDTYDAVRAFLLEGTQKVTAFVSSGDEITQGILAAARDLGKTIPDDISVLNLMDAPSMCFAHPPVSCLDMNFGRQFEVAFDLLEAAQRGEPYTPQNYIVEANIIERRSVGPVVPSSTRTRKKTSAQELTANLL